MLTKNEFKKILRMAMQAPSAHNTQATKITYNMGEVSLSLEEDRLLPVADPTDKDALISAGCFAEGLEIALNQYGYRLSNYSYVKRGDSVFRAKVIKSNINKTNEKEIFSDDVVQNRYCHRSKFVNFQNDSKVIEGVKKRTHMPVISRGIELSRLATDFDDANYEFLKCDDYYLELFGWLRLDRKRKEFNQDGMNLDSIGLSALEKIIAPIILKPSVFFVLKKLRLAKMASSSKGVILSATGILAVSCQKNVTYVERGRIFYREWLKLTEAGLAAFPLSVLVDSDKYREKWKANILVNEKVFINLLAFGPAESNTKPKRARLSVESILKEFVSESI